MKKVLLLLAVLVSASSFATTWNEPWQEKVIRDAESFVRARIIKSSHEKVHIEVLEVIAGMTVRKNVTISAFYDLHICSSSGGHGPELDLEGIDECYFLLKRKGRKNYMIATPSTGYNAVKDGKVLATYRHSYHQALVPQADYEQTMRAIFNSYHGKSYDTTAVRAYVSKYVSQPPAGFSKDQISTFFAQHVALETIYHLRLGGYTEQIIPFLNDTSNFHNQISGARALRASNASEALYEVIADTSRNNFVRVMCIRTLEELHPVTLKPRLTALAETASEEYVGFGGNIMDPRVCTSLPDVKRALKELLARL